MTQEEYKIERLKLESSFDTSKRELAKKCAYENNPYKRGDIFTDHIGSIIIERIQVSFGGLNDMPTCIYSGIELNKDGKPNKKQTKRGAWQGNDVNKKVKTA